jgi:hypothetical protein
MQVGAYGNTPLRFDRISFQPHASTPPYRRYAFRPNRIAQIASLRVFKWLM